MVKSSPPKNIPDDGSFQLTSVFRYYKCIAGMFYILFFSFLPLSTSPCLSVCPNLNQSFPLLKIDKNCLFLSFF